MNKLIRILFFLIMCCLGRQASAQDVLVDYTYLGSKSKIDLLILFGQQVDYAVNLYKIRYKTLDVHGVQDTASGLLVLPQVPAGTMLPMVVYDHGTSTGPTDVPSQQRGGFEVALAYASFGFATAAPDYLGLGDSRGFHPYIHAASEASASLDMLFASYEYLEFNGPGYDPNYLFLSGYSQGGHASMALHKLIDDFWSVIIPVTAATHMSGPYSVSGVMRNQLLSDESYGSPAYLAYIILGYNQIYHLFDDVHEVFADPYATSISNFFNGTINLTQLNTQLISQLSTEGDTVPKRILQDTFLAAIIANPDHPFNLAMAENDVYNFGPQEPTRLYYCGADEEIPIENTLIAEITMNSLGAVDLKSENLNPTFGHGACAFPAILSSIQYFLSFLSPSATKDFLSKENELKLYPNPTFDMVNIDWTTSNNNFNYQIFNSNGTMVDRGIADSGHLSMSGLPNGLYMIMCTSGNETRMGRVLRQ